MKKRVGSGSISQRYGSGDPDPHKNVTDPQHCLLANIKKNISLPHREKQDYKRKEVGGGGRVPMAAKEAIFYLHYLF
jgi:hypothetical protein